MTQTVEINQTLFDIDKVLNALEYLHEEVKTRLNEKMDECDVEAAVIRAVASEMDTYEFKRKIVNFLCGSYAHNIYREVADIVMNRIDRDIDAFITKRVNAQLMKYGIKCD